MPSTQITDYIIRSPYFGNTYEKLGWRNGGAPEINSWLSGATGSRKSGASWSARIKNRQASVINVCRGRKDWPARTLRTFYWSMTSTYWWGELQQVVPLWNSYVWSRSGKWRTLWRHNLINWIGEIVTACDRFILEQNETTLNTWSGFCDTVIWKHDLEMKFDRFSTIKGNCEWIYSKRM